MSDNVAKKRISNPLLKFAIEVGPLLVFFIANGKFGIFHATAAFMVAIIVSLAVNYTLEKRVPAMPLVTGIFVLVMGGLTLWLQDELFIKLKPTIVNTLFAVILAIGLMMGKLFLKHVFGAAFRIDGLGWQKLTKRWIWFFLFLAVVNEVVWRNFDTDFWVSFKLFGLMPITFIFAMAQYPLIRAHGGFPDMDEKADG